MKPISFKYVEADHNDYNCIVWNEIPQMAYGYQGTEWKQVIQIIYAGYLNKIQ